MPTTTNFGLRYPASTAAADGPTAFQNLANDTDAAIETQATAIAVLNGRYSRSMSFSVSVPDSTPTATGTFTTINQHNVPGTSPFSAGTFTAPVSGLYSALIYAPGVLNANRTTVRINLNGSELVGNDTTNGASGRVSAVLPAWWLAAGDTLTWGLYQNSGGTVTMTGFASVAQVG